MAKKDTINEPSFADLAKIVTSLSPLSSTLDKMEHDIPYWISTGNYSLNAVCSGSIFKGLPAGRVIGIAGPSETGKSFIALSTAVQAQKEHGCKIIWFDTEYAFPLNTAKDFGIDMENFILIQESRIDKITMIFQNIIQPLVDSMEKNGKLEQKYMFVLDSLGFTEDDRTAENNKIGKNVADMGYISKMKKKFFNSIITPCGKIGALFLVTNHTYTSLGSFMPTQVPSGGSGFEYGPSLTLLLSKAQFKEFENVKTGTIVTVKPFKSRFVVPNAKTKIVIESNIGLNKYVGLETFFTEEKAQLLGFGPGKFMKTKSEYIYDDSEIPKYWCDINTGKTFYSFGKIVEDENSNKKFAGAGYQKKNFTDERLEYINKWAEDMFKFKNISLDEIEEIDATSNIEESESESEVEPETEQE